MSLLVPSHWTLDGEAVDAEQDAASAALGGYDRATVRVPERQCRGAMQGSVLKAFLETGEVLWEGRLALPPVARRGICRLEAAGYKRAAEKAHGRLAYQVRGTTGWVDPAGAPHNYAPGNAVAQIRNTIQVPIENPTTDTITFTAPVVLWLPGTEIVRYAFTFRNATRIDVYLATGPDGVPTLEASHPAGQEVNPVDRTVSTVRGKDLILLEILGVLNIDSATTMTISDLRVNASRATVDDTLYTSELVVDVGNRLGWDTSGVESTAVNVLPLDVASGSWRERCLDLAAGLDDWQWRVTDDRGAGPFLEYTPWRRTFVTSLAAGAVEELVPEELFNRVIVWWTDVGGAVHSVSKNADPDPLEGTEVVNVFEHVLTEPQADDALAQRITSILLPRVSSPRWKGPVRVAAANREDAEGEADPRLILPGDLLRISDWDQGADVLLRIQDAEYDDSGASLGVDQPASLAGMLAQLG